MRRLVLLLSAVSFGAACSLITPLDELAPIHGADGGGADGPVADSSSDAGVDAPTTDAGDASAPTGALALAVGGQYTDYVGGFGQHACVIAAKDHSVYCWGANEHGQLGNGQDGAGTTSADLSKAGRVDQDSTLSPFTGVDQISLGAWHSCARRGTDVYCWGQRQSGAIGDGPYGFSAVDAFRPTHVPGVGATSVGAGGGHTCVVDLSGAVRCWGYNGYGQLGHPPGPPDTMVTIFFDTSGTPYCNGTPTLASFNATAVDVSSGVLDTCVLVGDSFVQCWGDNALGELASSSTGAATSTPNKVQRLALSGTAYLGSVTQLSSHGKHGCGLLKDGTVWCWGQNNGGQVGGAPNPSAYAIPVASVPDGGASAVSTGDGNTCAVTPSGNVWCWGFDSMGQLGDGNTASSSTAQEVKGPGGVGVLAGVSRVAVGFSFACALKTDGTVWCWGDNQHGELGNGTTTASPYPVQVQGIP